MKTVVSGSFQYLTAENITVPHAFTTRKGGVSTGYLESLNLGCNRGDDLKNVEENYRILGKELGFDIPDLVLTRQTHSDIVRCVTGEDGGRGINHRDYPECDGLVTNTPGLALTVFTADCTPILFYDPDTGAVGACHAGWRGTAAGIAAKTVDAMAEHFGSDPARIRAAIGPNIGQCCFETDQDVPEAMLMALGSDALPYIRRSGDKFFVDLKAINALWLRRRGVRNIEISTACTHCQHDLFWSHRYTGGQRGSQGAIILCKEKEA